MDKKKCKGCGKFLKLKNFRLRERELASGRTGRYYESRCEPCEALMRRKRASIKKQAKAERFAGWSGVDRIFFCCVGPTTGES